MSLDQWIALLAPALAALAVVGGGAGAYRWQKSVDRNEQLQAKRREIYVALLKAISDSISNKGATADAAFRTAKFEVFVCGSDEVIKKTKALNSQLEGGAESTSDSQLGAYAELVYAMRKDSFERSQLTVEELSKLTPFNAYRQSESGGNQ